jgi:hypothetical protein
MRPTPTAKDIDDLIAFLKALQRGGDRRKAN